MRRIESKPREIVWQPGKLIRTPAQLTPAQMEQRKPSRSLRKPLMITTAAFSMLGVAMLVVWMAFSWLSNPGSRLPAAPPAQPVVREVQVSKAVQGRAEVLVQQYMTALLKQRYDVMWSMLHPQVQAMWPGEKAFATFWQARFRQYTLQDFTIGTAVELSRWVNPETMVTYRQVIELPVSLQLQPDQVLQKQPLLPPEDLNPSQVFRNLPFIIQSTAGQNGIQSQWQVLQGGPADPEAPILPPLKPLNQAVRVPILMYHHISSIPTGNLLDLSLTVTREHFQQQLDYLKAKDYHTITFNQMFDALYFNGPLPLHPIILTFDDGYEDAYQFALPILQAHGYCGMFYIITGKVNTPDYLKWSEIRTMLAAGMQLGSHTIHHVSLGWIIIGAPKLTQQELQQSQAELEKQLGIVIQQFCYPSGEPFKRGTPLMQQRIMAMLAADGYVGATTDPGQTGTYQSSALPFDLLRIRVDGRESLLEFMGNIPPLPAPTAQKTRPIARRD